MVHRNQILFNIVSLFFIAIFSNWIVSLGDDEPSGMMHRQPLLWLAIVALVSIPLGYLQYRFTNWIEKKGKKKQD